MLPVNSRVQILQYSNTRSNYFSLPAKGNWLQISMRGSHKDRSKGPTGKFPGLPVGQSTPEWHPWAAIKPLGPHGSDIAIKGPHIRNKAIRANVMINNNNNNNNNNDGLMAIPQGDAYCTLPWNTYNIHIQYIYSIYIYIYVHTYTHIHTHIYIYKYIYTCILKILINNSWRKNKENHYRDGGLYVIKFHLNLHKT